MADSLMLINSSSRRKTPGNLKTLVVMALLWQCSQACFNYVCSDEFKTCTKKGGANVYVNSNACDSKCSAEYSVFQLKQISVLL